MYNPIDVETGAVRTVSGDGVIKSSGIGSCVAVVAYDPLRRIGGIAHVMLPGQCLNSTHKYPTRYCPRAIDELLHQLQNKGAHREDLVICLVGGANVLQREDCTIGKENIEAINLYLKKKGLRPVARRVGGTLWRSARLNVETGEIICTEGGQHTKLLWRPETKCASVNYSSRLETSETTVAG